MPHFIKWTLRTVYLVVLALLLLAFFSDAIFAAKPLPVAVWTFVAYFRGKALVDAFRRMFDAKAKPKIERAVDGRMRSWVLRTSSFRLAFDFEKAQFTLDAPRRSKWSDRGYFEPDARIEHGAGFKKTLPISGLYCSSFPVSKREILYREDYDTGLYSGHTPLLQTKSAEEEFAEYRDLRIEWLDLVPGKDKEGRDCLVRRSYTDRLASRPRQYFNYEGSTVSSGTQDVRDCRLPPSTMERPVQKRFDMGVEIFLLDNDPAVMAIFNPEGAQWKELREALLASQDRTGLGMAT